MNAESDINRGKSLIIDMVKTVEPLLKSHTVIIKTTAIMNN